MAACGGIEHILEKPLPDSPNFVEALKHNNNIDDSEMFGELHFKETPPSSLNQEREQYRHKKSISSDSISLCTERLGFDDVEETRSHDAERNERGEAFPPPISSIGPGLGFKSYREDGRFILKQVTQESLHAFRQHGRLQLHFHQHVHLTQGHNNQP